MNTVFKPLIYLVLLGVSLSPWPSLSMIPSVQAFAPTKGASAHANIPFKPYHGSSNRHSPLFSTNNKFANSYSDEAFGLIFLSTSVVAKDSIFAVLFLSFSAGAALWTNVIGKPTNRSVILAMPGAVALTTFLLRWTVAIPLVSVLLSSSNLSIPEPVTQLLTPFQLESVVCLVSMVRAAMLVKEEQSTDV